MTKFSPLKMACVVFVVCAATPISLFAQTLTTLQSFEVYGGSDPSTRLVQATDGNFYGTTQWRGAHNYGTGDLALATLTARSHPAAVLLVLVQPGGAQEIVREVKRPRLEQPPEVERLDPKEVEAVRKALNPGLEPPAAPRALGLFEPSHPTAQPSLHISPSFSPQAVDFMDLDPVRRAQRRLHDLGYLHREADIDGVMGPKTRLAARQFQQEKHLKITGELDDVTMSALEIRHSRSLLRPGLTDALHPGSVTPYSRETLDTLRKELGAFNFRITETKSPENVRYRLQDASSNVIEQSLDRRQLASKLNEILTQNGGKAISIELPGFSLSRTDALASSLTIQFRQVDPSLALSVPAVPTFTAPDPSLSKKPATWVRSSQIVIQRNGSDTYSSRVSFSDVFAKGRSFTLTIVQTSLNVVLDFLDSLGILSRSPIVWSAGSSLEQHVNYARADMKRRHPNLTDRDLQVMITDQAGNTGFVELRIETTFACS